MKTRQVAKPGSGESADALGHRDPRAGASPGYDEQQPPSAATAKRPGGRDTPDNEDGGVERDVDADATAQPGAPGRKGTRRP